MLQDAYWNTYTYGHPARVSRRDPSPKAAGSSIRTRSRNSSSRSYVLMCRPTRRWRPQRLARRAQSASSPRRSRPTAGGRTQHREAASVANPARPSGRTPAAPSRSSSAPARSRARRRWPATSGASSSLGRKDIERNPSAAARASWRASSSAASASAKAAERRTALRGPAGRPWRPADRPEPILDGREAARVDRDLPRRRQKSVLGRDAANPSDGQILLRARRPLVQRVPPTRGRRLRPRPPRRAETGQYRSTGACRPRLEFLAASGCGRR